MVLQYKWDQQVRSVRALAVNVADMDAFKTGPRYTPCPAVLLLLILGVEWRALEGAG